MGFSSLAVFTEWSPTENDSKMRLALCKEWRFGLGSSPFLSTVCLWLRETFLAGPGGAPRPVTGSLWARYGLYFDSLLERIQSPD